MRSSPCTGPGRVRQDEHRIAPTPSRIWRPGRVAGLCVIVCVVSLRALVITQTVRPAFEPMQPEALTAGATLANAFADFDGDSDLDLFVGFNGPPNRLYRNDDGKLVDAGQQAGVADARPTRAASWGDFDGDGDPDLLVGFAPGAGPVLRLYRNDAGRFTDQTSSSGLIVETGAVRQPVWVDMDGDGDLDLFVAFRDRPNALFRNERGRFADVAGAIGLADPRRTVGAIWFDYDEDGDLDVYVGNMDGDANGLYRNESGRFSDVAEASGVGWGGRAPRDPAHGTVRPCAADVDGDGRLDLFAANYGPLGLLLNRGAGRFEDVSAAWQVAIDARYDACAFADFDNDGRIDLFVNGTVTGGVSYRDHLFRNAGARFEDVTPENIRALAADHGAQWGDVDGDGLLDLALTGVGKSPLPLLLRNVMPASTAGRSLQVRVTDDRGRAVLAGAEVRVRDAGTGRLLATGLVDAGSGYNAQNDMPVHVGIGGAERIDIEVVYPARGRRNRTSRNSVDPSRYAGSFLTLAVRP